MSCSACTSPAPNHALQRTATGVPLFSACRVLRRRWQSLSLEALGDLLRLFSRTVNPVLATDYGNAAVFLIGIPLLLVALLAWPYAFLVSRRGVDGRGCCVVAGLLSLLVGAVAFYSLPEAREGDVRLTQVLVGVALVLFLALVCSAIYMRPRNSGTKSDTDRHGPA